MIAQSRFETAGNTGPVCVTTSPTLSQTDLDSSSANASEAKRALRELLTELSKRHSRAVAIVFAHTQRIQRLARPGEYWKDTTL